jgi:hypothetical protein
MDQPITNMYDLLEALAAAILAAEPSKREALAKTIDAYCKDCPEDFFWAIGPQAPTFLSRLLHTVDSASHLNQPGKAQHELQQDASQLAAPYTFIFG